MYLFVVLAVCLYRVFIVRFRSLSDLLGELITKISVWFYNTIRSAISYNKHFRVSPCGEECRYRCISCTKGPLNENVHTTVQ